MADGSRRDEMARGGSELAKFRHQLDPAIRDTSSSPNGIGNFLYRSFAAEATASSGAEV